MFKANVGSKDLIFNGGLSTWNIGALKHRFICFRTSLAAVFIGELLIRIRSLCRCRCPIRTVESRLLRISSIAEPSLSSSSPSYLTPCPFSICSELIKSFRLFERHRTQTPKEELWRSIARWLYLSFQNKAYWCYQWRCEGWKGPTA